MSPSIERAFFQLERATNALSPLSIVGESGTGKVSLAEWVHVRRSPAERPIVTIDGGRRASLASPLSATARGTLIIRNVGYLCEAGQQELLEALSEGSVWGGALVACNPRPLADEASAGRLNQELYLKLSRSVVTLPPLRDRLGDIPALCTWFLGQHPVPGHGSARMTAEAEQRLASHHWPGNVAELWDTLCAGLRTAQDGILRVHDVRLHSASSAPQSGLRMDDDLLGQPYKEARDHLVAEFERACATRWLQAFKGNVARSAASAGLSRQAFHGLLNRTGVKAADFRKGGRRSEGPEASTTADAEMTEPSHEG